jgi:hypothetical protein
MYFFVTLFKKESLDKTGSPASKFMSCDKQKHSWMLHPCRDANPQSHQASGRILTALERAVIGIGCQASST